MTFDDLVWILMGPIGVLLTVWAMYWLAPIHDKPKDTYHDKS